MNNELTFETYGTAKFRLEDWYTIEELEKLLLDLKAVKERQDEAMLKAMKESGMVK
jgi:glutamate synthase domain-containing protein 2